MFGRQAWRERGHLKRPSVFCSFFWRTLVGWLWHRLLLWSLGDLALFYVWCWHQICLNSWIVHVALFRQFESHTHKAHCVLECKIAFFPWDINKPTSSCRDQAGQMHFHFLRGHRDGFKIWWKRLNSRGVFVGSRINLIYILYDFVLYLHGCCS